LKATKLCEHKIKEKVNTKHIKTVITDLVQKRQYWQAYQKVTKAIAEGAKLDDQEIIAELSRWKDLNSKLSQQLADLQTQPKDLEEYQRLRQENEQLRQDKDTLISIFDV
jgi:chromosome condensin MukBEF ATPase and DNA-binding subunit MukB